MGMYIYIDIINFILAFLLMDFFNGAHNNYLATKFKSGVLTIIVLLLSALLISIMASLFLATKIALFIIIVITIFGITVLRARIKRLNQYTNVECGKDEFFANQKVMIFVPHQDDDINLMGGVIEQYVKYGSEVYVVFATNGDGDKRYDMSRMGYTRMREAIIALAILGVPEKSIVFLGYGDGWDDSEPHIYNAESNKIIRSTSQRTATYGLKKHPAYREGRSYTYVNYYDDIMSVISENKPDVIYCIDYDSHNDHRALSMFFEKVLGDILKNTNYRPTVYKGYGYRTAWNAEPDFCGSVNIISTLNKLSDNDVELYDWNNRVRVPINISCVNRYLPNSKLYHALSEYASQKANENANRIINGDKVFWQRRTDSVLYKANVSVSSGDKNKLTDFMLLDCDDLKHNGNYPYDGVWRPDADDSEKSIYISFDSKTHIDHIVLYDNPSPNDNILNAIISFDDGTKLETGRLESHGDATKILVDKQIQSFTVKIDKYEGEHIGLSEIEAFDTNSYGTSRFYKFTDDKDNFVYDYIVPENGEQILKIYSNHDNDFDIGNFVLRSDNSKCVAKFSGNEIIATCPKGQKCQIELLSQDKQVIDRIIIRNPYRIERYFLGESLRNITNRSYLKRVIKFVKSKFCVN